MPFKSADVLLLFKVNDEDESKMVQEELFKYDFKWMSNDNRYVNVIEYPSYIFANMFGKHKILTYYNIDENTDINIYLEDNFGSYDCRFFNAIDSKQINTILKYGVVKPSYLPKSIKKVYESKDEGYDFLFFKVENMKEFEKIRDYLINKNYLIHERDNDKIFNMSNDDFPIYLIIDKENTMFALSEWNKKWTEGDVLDYINYINNDTNNKILNKILTVNDIRNLDIIFKGTIIPSYQPRKVKKFYESSSINIIVVHTDNYNDALEFQNYLQDLGYTWHYDGEKDVIQEYQDRDVYIFKIEINNKNIEYACFEYVPDSRLFVNNMLLFYPKDIRDIQNIIKYNKIVPNYKPKNIKKFESFITENNKNILTSLYKPKKN